MADGGEGFDAGAFAAKMSSIGHAGNVGGGGGGAANLSPTIQGSLSSEIGMGGEVMQFLEKIASSGFLQILPVFKLTTSLVEGAQATLNGIIDAPIQSLGKLAPSPTPIVAPPSPHQGLFGGSKGQGH